MLQSELRYSMSNVRAAEAYASSSESQILRSFLPVTAIIDLDKHQNFMDKYGVPFLGMSYPESVRVQHTFPDTRSGRDSLEDYKAALSNIIRFEHVSDPVVHLINYENYISSLRVSELRSFMSGNHPSLSEAVAIGIKEALHTEIYQNGSIVPLTDAANRTNQGRTNSIFGYWLLVKDKDLVHDFDNQVAPHSKHSAGYANRVAMLAGVMAERGLVSLPYIAYLLVDYLLLKVNDRRISSDGRKEVLAEFRGWASEDLRYVDTNSSNITIPEGVSVVSIDNPSETGYAGFKSDQVLMRGTDERFLNDPYNRYERYTPFSRAVLSPVADILLSFENQELHKAIVSRLLKFPTHYVASSTLLAMGLSPLTTANTAMAVSAHKAATMPASIEEVCVDTSTDPVDKVEDPEPEVVVPPVPKKRGRPKKKVQTEAE